MKWKKSQIYPNYWDIHIKAYLVYKRNISIWIHICMQIFKNILPVIMVAIRDYTSKFQETTPITFYLKMCYKQKLYGLKNEIWFNIGYLLIARPMQSFKSYSKENPQIHMVILNWFASCHRNDWWFSKKRINIFSHANLHKN